MGIRVSYKLKHSRHVSNIVNPLQTCEWRWYRWVSGCHTNWNITVTSARLSKCVGAATVRGNRLRKTRACTSEEGKEGELIPSPLPLSADSLTPDDVWGDSDSIVTLSGCQFVVNIGPRRLGCAVCGGCNTVTGYLDAAPAWRGVGSGEVAGGSVVYTVTRGTQVTRYTTGNNTGIPALCTLCRDVLWCLEEDCFLLVLSFWEKLNCVHSAAKIGFQIGNFIHYWRSGMVLIRYKTAVVT